MLGVHPRLMIFALAVLCALYTARGGLRAVSRAAWAQTALIAAAPLLVLAAASKHWPGGWAGALQAARDAGRLGLGKPADAVTLAPAFFAALATYGADQELAQNALAASSVKKARLAMAAAVAASLTVGLAYLAAGTGLFAFYKLNPGMTAPSAPGLALPHFVLTSLPAGARGLAAAALLMAAAHLPLCSLSAAAVEDFYRPWLAPKQSEAHYLRVSKGAVWFFAAALCALALLWNESEAWLAFLLKLGSMLLGPLLGFFLFALFSRRWADRANVIAAAVTAGLGAVLVALAEAGRARFDLSWLIVGGALLTAILARQLAPYLGER
jgi:Na+/proline symporter